MSKEYGGMPNASGHHRLGYRIWVLFQYSGKQFNSFKQEIDTI